MEIEKSAKMKQAASFSRMKMASNREMKWTWFFFSLFYYIVASEENKVKNQVELPYYSKYLLLASYFASYNPANTDRRFFTKKSSGRMSKRAKTSAKAAKNLDKKFLGMAFFWLTRCWDFAIFWTNYSRYRLQYFWASKGAIFHVLHIGH